MTDSQVLLEFRDGVAEITLNRPEKLNALTPEMVVRLADAWDEIERDAAVRVAILTGAGDRGFCAGADLGRLAPLLTRARPAEDAWDERLLAQPRLLNRAMLRTCDFTTPVIAAARGPVVAGGMEIMLACDLRVAAENSVFGLAEVRRGLVPTGGGVARIVRQVPWAKAAEILLIGDTVNATDALAMGLVNQIVAPELVLDTARKLAERMAENGPLAMRKAKETMLRSSGRPLDEAFQLEDECAKVVMRSNDAKEGPRAFTEKRRPVFTGS